MTVQSQSIVLLSPDMVPEHLVFPLSFIEYGLPSQSLAVMVALTLHVSFPDVEKDIPIAHPPGGNPKPSPSPFPLPPPFPVGGGVGNNTLDMELKNEIIELNIEAKKLFMS